MREKRYLVTSKSIEALNESYLKLGLRPPDLIKAAGGHKRKRIQNQYCFGFSAFILLLTLVALDFDPKNFFLTMRCLVPNNYFTWEATRPISDCLFCSNLTEVLELPNVTREEFAPYAYSSRPIVIRGAFLHWSAMKSFDFNFFKELYKSVDHVEEPECQFLHFKSDFITLKDVFKMSESRVNNLPGEKSWYVGWNNCHPKVLKALRLHYPKPHFLPEDCEIPCEDFVFMGYGDAASMHLDFISRLMWQAQLKGSKVWNLKPPSECQDVCKPMSFSAYAGDAVLLDTRIWYHATLIPEGQFSLSVQSEYG